MIGNSMEDEKNRGVEHTEPENKVEILNERLLRAVGKYSDYSRYEMNIYNVGEEYNETLEIYNFDIWYGNSTGTLREKAEEMLQVTVDIFRDLRENAECELYYIMSEIAELDERSQLAILGIVLEKGAFTKTKSEEIFDEWSDYEWSQNEAMEAFLGVLKEWRQSK